MFSGVIDPVGAGLITSLAKPGGNLTGTLLYEESIVGKWLAMLKEISPQLARVAVLTNPKTTSQAFNQAAKVFAALAYHRVGAILRRNRCRNRTSP